MDRISRRSQGPEGVRFGNHRISSLLFADDVVLMASSGQDLQHVLERFAAECEAAGMRISTSKSEAMVLDRKRVACPLRVGGEVLPQVEEFKYLGVLFTSEGKMEREIDRRIGAASAVMRSVYLDRHGKMFKSLDLSLIVEFMLMFYKDKPIDWLLDHIMWVKVCNPEKDAKHCDRQKANLRIRFKPSLFQHVGTHSSLAGKIQKLKDKDFGKQTLHKGHANPLAEVTTSLKTYQHFTLEKAYLGEDFFWAFTPVAGDFIRIRFFTPVRIERYFFRSGNIEHPGDKLFNTSVEVLPFDNIQAEKEALTEGREKTPKYHRTEDGFIRIGTFQNGIAEGEVDPTFGPLEAMRLSVLTDSPVWVILSEAASFFHQDFVFMLVYVSEERNV
ncbi:hypothetical protein L3Q82_005606 [Scortum barcoo]|uniref:Uncharacterized protein n=1 Tax=Scortum barcoo TaxID=214431 RepID=A0ACB8V8A6_9TELE|nr:hypothetical protein L3Q82_005606 [Scortum barcoo]